LLFTCGESSFCADLASFWLAGLCFAASTIDSGQIITIIGIQIVDYMQQIVVKKSQKS
jgi:hypothetical protein